ncbi:MAG TPA: presenilin family intramembrane aspartyl protease [Candidatus Nanoarchaeia archaeon]|nr:presenilin family intramembrane aspartyl protease [Candidatus Nanoarchaeia archaeon]
MKHDLKITLLLVFLFLASHVIGLFIVKHYLPDEQPLPLNIQKPEFDEKTSYFPIFVTIIVATALALLLLKFRAVRLWKLWFFLSVFITLSISFNSFLPEIVAVAVALIFSIVKIFKPSIIVHNFTELFIYGGLAAIFVPVLNVVSAAVLLVLISIYDFIAVWKTKHMVSLAKFQAESNVFAGLFVPYSVKSIKAKNVKSAKSAAVEQAILGGGDIGFPLLFSGVIMKIFGLQYALIVSASAAIALTLLFFLAEKKKFYPAMPFLTIGCLVGYVLVLALKHSVS